MTELRIPVGHLAWASDLHLDFARPKAFDEFCISLAETSADALAITGDISHGGLLKHHLSLIATRIQKPVFIVLGNHDRYHASFAEVEEQMRRVEEHHPNVHRLTGSEIVELSARSALVGVDGWADGQSGSGPASPIVLNDTILIEDLATLTHAAAWAKIAALSRAFADTIKPTLETAMSSFREVTLLTHVPPLREATWHEGGISGPDFLPHFCNAPLGEVIRDACGRHRETKLTVLCGHTHSAGVHVEDNLTVLTAASVYGAPRIDRVLLIPG